MRTVGFDDVLFEEGAKENSYFASEGGRCCSFCKRLSPVSGFSRRSCGSSLQMGVGEGERDKRI